MQKKTNVVPTPHLAERLKAERVQLQLKALPGWRLRSGGRAIARTFALAGAQGTVAFLGLLVELARKGRLPQVDLRPGEATVTLWSPKPGWLTAEDYELAASLKGTTAKQAG